MRRAALAVIACFAAIVVQVTILDNLAFPGGSPPDLVLLVVVTLALAMGPLPGAVTGFGAGLAADLAPPATHLLGQDALVFCLVGYLLGLLRGPLEDSSWLPLGAIAVGAATGECLYALTGMVFGDPDVTWRAAQQVVPVSLGYEVLLSPFVLFAVSRLAGETAVMGTIPAGFLTGRELMPAWGGIGLMSGSVRDSGSGRGPRLRGTGADGWIGAMRPRGTQSAAKRRPPGVRLRLRGGVAGSAAGGSLTAAHRPARQPATVNLHLGSSRRRNLAGAPAAFSSAAGTPRAASTKLRSGAFTRGQPAWAAAAQASRPRTAKLRLGSHHGLAARRPAGAAASGVAARGAATAGRRAPGKGTFAGQRRGVLGRFSAPLRALSGRPASMFQGGSAMGSARPRASLGTGRTPNFSSRRHWPVPHRSPRAGRAPRFRSRSRWAAAGTRWRWRGRRRGVSPRSRMGGGRTGGLA